MLRFLSHSLLLLFILPVTLPVAAQDGYGDQGELTARLKRIADKYPQYATLKSVAVTKGRKDIWLLEIGGKDRSISPALAVVGGIQGDHLLGTELVAGFAEKLLAGSDREEIRDLLAGHTFYLFPDVNPDARAQYFAPLRYERTGNANTAYTDRYGRQTEHPYKDLNGDGMITLMRIRDSSGEWIKNPDDGRIMVRALKEEGEMGEYRVFREGIDISKVERWNEAGVDFNRNFSFKYPFFTVGAGEHAVSEIETRAVAQFLFDAVNVYAVISFGPANNLSEPLRYNEREASGRIITGILEGDALVNRMVSKKYNEITGETAGPGSAGTDGDFFQWAYFHYGRHSFSTPGWKFPRKVTRENGSGKMAARDDDHQLSFIQWAEEENITNFFVPWGKIEYPWSPDLEVEVGGIVPFVMTNPPFSMAGPIVESHYDFIIEIAGMKPSVEILNVKTEELGRQLFRITADIKNSGILPTVSQIGERLRWVQKAVIRLETADNQNVISGKTIEVLSAIEGGRIETRSWLIRGKGRVRLRAGAENTGFDEIMINL